MNFKGVKLLVVAALLVLFVTGCSFGKTETLTCTNTQNVSGIKIDSNAKISFKGNVVSDLVLTMDISATSDLMKQSWSIVEETYNKQYAAVEKDGVKVTTKSDASNYKYTITIQADPTKAKKEDLDKYGMGSLAGAKDTIDNTKKDLEAAGFVCEK